MASVRIAMRPFGSVAELPSVTSKVMDAGPKYRAAEVYTSVWSLTTSELPSAWVALTEAESVRRTWDAPSATTYWFRSIVRGCSLFTRRVGALRLTCGRASS